MTDLTEVLCFSLIVTCLGGCFIRAFWEIEAARQRRRDRRQFVRAAMRTVSQPAGRGR